MAEALLRLQVALPDDWRPDAEPAAEPQAPALARSGLTVSSAWSASHRLDGARVALYSVRGSQGALDSFDRRLRAGVAADDVDGRLAWAARGEGWCSLSMLQPAAETAGPALLWSSYLPEATAAERLQELLAAPAGSRWQLR